MANIKVSELNTATSFNDEDYTMIVQNGENKKITRQNFLKNIYTEYVLYNNVNGSIGTITLNESAENYDYLEIFFRTDDNIYNSLKVSQPNNKRINLIGTWVDTSQPVCYLKVKVMTISGTSISNYGDGNCNIRMTNSGNTINATDLISITKVVGYKLEKGD